MHPLSSHRRSVLPVLYVGSDLNATAYDSLRAHRIGVVVAENASRASRLLSQFRVAAIVYDVPDLRGIDELSKLEIPMVVLAARDAACDLDAVTILPRHTETEDLAAIIHGVVWRGSSSAAERDAA